MKHKLFDILLTALGFALFVIVLGALPLALLYARGFVR